MSNLRGQREGLGFSQPVTADRVTPVEVFPLEQSSEDLPSRISIREGGVENHGSIVNRTIDGKVYIRFDSHAGEYCYDLAGAQYRWL